jgi:hypothetical protein
MGFSKNTTFLSQSSSSLCPAYPNPQCSQFPLDFKGNSQLFTDSFVQSQRFSTPISMQLPTPANSKSKAKSPGQPRVCFDVLWLSGQKPSPDPLPSREEFLELKNTRYPTQKKKRTSVNILASLLAVGLCSLASYALLQSGWLPGETPQGTPHEITAENPSSHANALAPAPLTPEQQRQADETIEAILALQEMAVPNNPNPPPTQKR